MVFKTQLFNNNGCNSSLARTTTADGVQNTAISNNTDAITAETLATEQQQMVSKQQSL
jgi:hypothetical protein